MKSFPPVPRMPTFEPPPDRGEEGDTLPPDNSLVGQIRELAKACQNLGELAVKLETSLLQHAIAIVTEEHKANHAHERIDKLTKRVDELEQAAAE